MTKSIIHRIPLSRRIYIWRTYIRYMFVGKRSGILRQAKVKKDRNVLKLAGVTDKADCETVGKVFWLLGDRRREFIDYRSWPPRRCVTMKERRGKYERSSWQNVRTLYNAFVKSYHPPFTITLSPARMLEDLYSIVEVTFEKRSRDILNAFERNDW